MNIKTIPPIERPREKLCHFGVSALTNSELMAIVLQSGSREESAIELGQNIINLFDHGIQGLNDVTVEELTAVKGVGIAKACQISAAVELGRRVSKCKINILGKINSPKTVVEYFQEELRHLNKEKFIVVFLNTKNLITSYEVVSVGSLSASIVHPREVFNRAIKKSAASIILIHNHPSGNPTPSREDEAITKRLCNVGEVVGIKILDHIIISEDGYFSFKEMDIL
ncbi:MAG: DNA repair protein RadC [Clostridiales bacterium]|nr:DNA repair protein RadC [Clostridiales bacterium]